MTNAKGFIININGIEIINCSHSFKEHVIWQQHGHVLTKGAAFSFLIFDMLALHIMITLTFVIRIHFILIVLPCILHLYDPQNCLQVQICDAGKDKMALEVSWVTDINDRC